MNLTSKSLLIAALSLLTITASACQQSDGRAELRPVEATLGAKGADQKGSDGRPNIIYILSDDQDRQSLAAMPRLQKLFPQVFVNQIITTPLCCPSRETALTGQFTHNHGVYSNLPYRGYLPGKQPFGGWAAAGSRRENLGRWLQRSGYYTALIGKYLNGFDQRRPIPKGWDYFVAALEDEEKGYFNYRLNENGQLRSYGQRAEQYSINVFVERAKQALLRAERAGKPAFIFFTPPTPHSGSVSERQPLLNPEPAPQERRIKLPFTIPEVSSAASFNESDLSDKPSHVAEQPPLTAAEQVKFQRWQKARWLSLYSLDREIAELVSYADNSRRPNYMFYSTDNGFLLGQHRLRAKKFPYEESINFPLLVRKPRKNLDGQRTAGPSGTEPRRPEPANQQLIANIDLAPTILDLAGAQAPPGWVIDGRSLVPLIDRWPKQAAVERQAIYIAGYPLGVGDPSGSSYRPYRGLRTKNELFVWYQRPADWPLRSAGEFEYYRIDRDPDQLNNLAAKKQYQPRIKRLRTLTRELSNCRGVAECTVRRQRLAPAGN